MKYKIIITGANGMLGSSFCKLYNKNNSIYAMHRDIDCYVPCIENYSFDLEDKFFFKKIFNFIKPDIVIHCAGLIDLEKCEKAPDLAKTQNIIIPEYIAKLCSSNTKLVYISTDQVYGQSYDHSEKSLDLEPLNVYGKTKLAGEKAVKNHCSDYLIIRTNIFGLSVKPGKVSSAEWICNSLIKRQEITLFTDYLFSPIFTEALAEIILLLININFSGTINIGSPEACSKYDFGMTLAEKFGFDKSLILKGLMKNHEFSAKRSQTLSLNTNQISDLKINIPNWSQSIEMFYKKLSQLK